MSIAIKRFSGELASRYVEDLARLRIEVFREFPYLYDGSYEYETDYLRTYLGVADSVIVVALDGERVVGASTGLPLSVETDSVKQAFIEQGYGLERVFYFGESVLEAPYRGKGLGVRFFEERELHVSDLARFDYTAFCAVERERSHPRRPSDYVPLDRFWINRGYRRHPELHTTFSWRDLDEASESPKPMVFWLKRVANEGAD